MDGGIRNCYILEADEALVLSAVGHFDDESLKSELFCGSHTHSFTIDNTFYHLMNNDKTSSRFFSAINTNEDYYISCTKWFRRFDNFTEFVLKFDIVLQ